MKNSTKIRLHLSKQLFESLTKQVIAESKKGDMSGGAYTEAVKTPKGEKKDKAPKEEGKADKGAKMNKVPEKSIAAPLKTATKAFKATTGGMKNEMETMTAETPMKKDKEQVEEYWGLEPGGIEAIITQIFGGILGSGILGTIIYGIKNDIKKGKSKKEAALIAAEKLKAAVEKSPDKEK